jgi:hypothetical protein
MLILNNKTGSGIVQLQEEVLTELTKLFKPNKKFKCYDDVKAHTNLKDNDLEYIIKTIENRIDPIGWIKKNIKIYHPLKGLMPFDLYDYQTNTIKLFLAKHFILTLKSRQVGMSTVTQAFCLWSALNYQKYNVLIISAGQRNAQKFLEKIKNMYDLLPNDIFKLKLLVDNKSTLQFANGSTITALPATSQSARGESVNLFVIDEAGFIENIDAVYQACYPTISRAFPKKKNKSGKPFGIIIISTPNGIAGTGKWYFDMYSGALNKTNKYVPIKVHWSLIPEFDDEWYLDQCMQLNWDYRKIASELELSFVSSGNTYIPSSILDTIGTDEPIAKDYNDNLWIWEPPIKGETYVIGVDVAYGDKKDASVISVLKSSTLEQVAEYEDNAIIVDKFADIVIDIAELYNNALTNIERNAVGKVLIDKIVDKVGYGGINLYRDINKNDLTHKKGDRSTYKTDIGTLVGNNRDMLLANMYGIVLNKYTEALNNIISGDNTDIKTAREKFEQIIKNKKGDNILKKHSIIRSERLHHQLLGFIVDNHNKASGTHDDCVMAWVHALYCYTKSKHLLLRDAIEAKNVVMGYDDKYNKNYNLIKFMQANSTSKLWNSTSADELAKMMEDEQNEMNNEINSDDENKKTKKTSLTDIYKNLYGL